MKRILCPIILAAIFACSSEDPMSAPIASKLTQAPEDEPIECDLTEIDSLRQNYDEQIDELERIIEAFEIKEPIRGLAGTWIATSTSENRNAVSSIINLILVVRWQKSNIYEREIWAVLDGKTVLHAFGELHITNREENISVFYESYQYGGWTRDTYGERQSLPYLYSEWNYDTLVFSEDYLELKWERAQYQRVTSGQKPTQVAIDPVGTEPVLGLAGTWIATSEDPTGNTIALAYKENNIYEYEIWSVEDGKTVGLLYGEWHILREQSTNTWSFYNYQHGGSVMDTYGEWQTVPRTDFASLASTLVLSNDHLDLGTSQYRRDMAGDLPTNDADGA